MRAGHQAAVALTAAQADSPPMTTNCIRFIAGVGSLVAVAALPHAQRPAPPTPVIPPRRSIPVWRS